MNASYTKEEILTLIETINDSGFGDPNTTDRYRLYGKIQGLIYLLSGQDNAQFTTLKDVWDLLGVAYVVQNNQINRI